jgi:colicin import membrane protein
LGAGFVLVNKGARTAPTHLEATMLENHSERVTRRHSRETETTSVQPHAPARQGWRAVGAAAGAVAIAVAGGIAVLSSTAAASPASSVSFAAAAPQRAPLPLAAVTAIGSVDQSALDKRVEALTAESARIVQEQEAAKAAAEAAARAEKARAEKAAQKAADKAAKQAVYANADGKDHSNCAEKNWSGK